MMKAEQFLDLPAERLRLFAPSLKKGFGVADGLLPTIVFDELGTFRAERCQGIAVVGSLEFNTFVPGNAAAPVTLKTIETRL